MKYWTAEQDAQLRTLYATPATAREIAIVMGRSKASIKCRITVLGLKKPDGITNSGRFQVGGPTWNKGMKGLQIGGKETQFKPGHLGGTGIEPVASTV